MYLLMDEIGKKARIHADPLLYLPITFFPAGLALKLPSVVKDQPLGLRFPLLQPTNHTISTILSLEIRASL